MHRTIITNFIILSGSERNVGKTFLASALIRAYSKQIPLVALKISPHVHNSLGNTELRASAVGIRIFEDMGPHHKSSGRFLESGAAQSFFMETSDEHLQEGFGMFMNECNPENHAVICESGALSRLIKPGVLIFITSRVDNLPDHKLATLHLADVVLPAKTFSTTETIERISFSENGWHLTPVKP